jgi:hypothetical protein
MAKVDLDLAQVLALFQQMRGVGMAQGTAGDKDEPNWRRVAVMSLLAPLLAGCIQTAWVLTQGMRVTLGETSVPIVARSF